jgi:hypothetical protein
MLLRNCELATRLLVACLEIQSRVRRDVRAQSALKL